jgi:pimeloyl-ACP methyl ester carboxylesterase
VLVMPDANGGRRISLQCLNVRHGPRDATYLAQDVPAYLTRILRVQPQGPAWGIAGYSEGGFCAANLALVYRLRYGAAGVLSGSFTPRLVLVRQPGVQLIVVPGGGHAMATWRALVPSLLEWMTPLLATAAQHPTPVSQVGKPRVSQKGRHPQARISQAARGSVRDAATPPA